MLGSERAPVKVCARRALLPSAAPHRPCLPAGHEATGLSCSAGDLFCNGTGSGRGTGRTGGRERGALEKMGGMALRGGRRDRLRSFLLSLTASWSSPQPAGPSPGERRGS